MNPPPPPTDRDTGHNVRDIGPLGMRTYARGVPIVVLVALALLAVAAWVAP